MKDNSRPDGLVLSLIRSNSRILALLIGIVSAAAMLFCIEAIFYVLNHRENIEQSSLGPLYQYDELLGYKPKPNVVVPEIKRRNGEVIFDVTYSIDSYGRRITPVQNLEDRVQTILFFGCSFTFGTGVNDNETIPFYVSQFAPKYMPYNYGYRGYGPQAILAQLQSDEIIKQVHKTDGTILVYTYIDGHISRITGSMRVLKWAHHFPYYIIDSYDRLVRKGNFTSGRRFLTYFYQVIGRSQFVQYFDIDHPRINNDHIRLTARIIEESRNAFRDKFDSDNFYVLIYPGQRRYGKELIHYLKKAGVRYLDYSRLQDKMVYDRIKGDGHPTAKSHRAIAARLVKDLGIFGDDE